jgi:hypothetical protein
MAKMLPPPDENVIFRSEAERAVYQYFDEQAPDEWAVLYSLWFQGSVKKIHSEVDFLVITEHGCFCLEIKGHNVWRDEKSVWHFETLDGSRHRTSNEGPFDQIREAYYDVRNHLESVRKVDYFYNLVWGHGVVTPDCALEVPRNDASVDPSMLADLRIFPEKMDEFVAGLTGYWRQRVLDHKKRIGRDAGEVSLNVSQGIQQDLVLSLRPAIRPMAGVGITSLEVARQADVLTEDQYVALDFSALEPRLILHGSAGTGKTLIGFEQATRLAASGNVLFVCFNSRLADSLRKKCLSLNVANLSVFNYHQLVKHLADEAGINFDLSEGWDVFNEQAFDLVYQAMQELPEFQYYDYLVVDEAQDLLSRAFFDVLDLLLREGLKGGRWCVCVDPDQAIYGSQYDRETYESMLSLSHKISLTVNCRNTKPISAYFRGISNFGQKAVRSTKGPDVVIEYYEDYEDYERLLKRSLNSLVTEFRKAKISPSSIAVLTGDKQYVEGLSVKTREEIVLPIVSYNGETSENKMQWSTIHSFKGMESMAVVLTGLANVSDIDNRRLFYVGASRARTHLIVLLPKLAEEQVQDALPRILEGLR